MKHSLYDTTIHTALNVGPELYYPVFACTAVTYQARFRYDAQGELYHIQARSFAGVMYADFVKYAAGWDIEPPTWLLELAEHYRPTQKADS
jgi:hypothetical protein